MQRTDTHSATPRPWTRWLLLALLAAGILFLIRLPQPFPHHLTKYDYRAYWGASYLLAHGEAFADPDRLFALQQELTGWQEQIPQMTWNPPWLLVWFIPYTWTGFDRSSWLWFLTSFALIFGSVIMLWHIYTPPALQRRVWLPLLLTFTFVPTLTTLLVGQITSLLLAGLAGFLFFWQRRQPFRAGLFLSLCTAKPHLIFITLPLLLLHLLRRRCWRTLAGFSLPLLLGTALAFFLRPTLLAEYGAALAYGGLLARPIPTFPSYLAQTLNAPLLRYSGLLLLAAALVIWHRRRAVHWPLADLVSLTVVLSLAGAFYGWSFDVLIYALPIAQCCAWALQEKGQWPTSLLILALFLLIGALAWYQRSLGGRDDIHWWIPTTLAALYLLSRISIGRRLSGPLPEPPLSLPVPNPPHAP